MSEDLRKLVGIIATLHGQRTWRDTGAQDITYAVAVAKQRAKVFIGVEAVRTYAIMLIEGTADISAQERRDQNPVANARQTEAQMRAEYLNFLNFQFETTVGLGHDLGITHLGR